MSDRKSGIYSVGELRDPRPSDDRYDSQIEAEQVARKDSFPDRALGIWRDADGELVAIAYDGLLYWP